VTALRNIPRASGITAGASYSGYEFSSIQGYSPNDASGAQAGQANGPNVANMKNNFGLNALRLTINQASWLSMKTYDTSGMYHDSNPRGTYQTEMIAKVQEALNAGFKVILDLHWTAPSNIAPMRQQQMADSHNSPNLWASIAAIPLFKNNPNVIFELFNEPIMDATIISGGTYAAILKSGGVLQYAECEGFGSLIGGSGYRQVKSLELSSVTGHFKPGSTVTKGAITAVVVDHDVARNLLYYRNASGTFTTGAGISVTTLAKRAMFSEGLPAAASSGTASRVCSATNSLFWRSSGAMPATIAIDVSSVIGSYTSPVGGTGNSKPICLTWCSELTYSYDTQRYSTSGPYNMPMDWTVEVNSGAGGGAAPTTGWTVVKTVTGNYKTNGAYVIDMVGRNWVRFNVSAIRGSVGNSDCALRIALHDATDCVTGAYGGGTNNGTVIADGILLVGDSIMAGGFEQDVISGFTTPTLGNTIAATTGHSPPTLHAGQPGWKTSDFLADDGTGTGTSVMENYLALCPFKYVVIALGANDAAGSATPNTSLYTSRMLQLAQMCIDAGRIPIIPTITYSNNVNRETGHAALNAAMATTLASHPEILVGPDAHAYFAANPTQINPDGANDFGLHPTLTGYDALRTVVYGGWFASTLYAASATVANANKGWPVAGYQDLVNAVRGVGANNMVLCGGLEYSNNLSSWLANVPTDSAGAGKLGCAWHPYPPQKSASALTIANGGTGHAINDILTMPKPNTCYAPAKIRVTAVSSGVITAAALEPDGNGITGGRYLATNLSSNPIAQASTTGTGVNATFNFTSYSNFSSVWSDPANRPTVEAIVAAGYPVHITETGEHSYSGLVGSPWLDSILPWAVAHASSVYFWSWNSGGGFNWNPSGGANDVLIKDVTGTPSDGYGVVAKAWVQTQ
jgi:hypothetical protein